MSKMREKIIFANNSFPFCLGVVAVCMLPSASSGGACQLWDPRFAERVMIKFLTFSKRHLSDSYLKPHLHCSRAISFFL